MHAFKLQAACSTATAGRKNVQLEERWSARRTIGFVVATCGAFWVAVALLVALALGGL